MQRYVAERIFAVESAENDLYGGTKRVPIYLASEVDAKMRRNVVDAEARVRRDEKERQGGRIAAAVQREREEIVRDLRKMIDEEKATGCYGRGSPSVDRAISNIRSRGESKPEPRLGTNPPEEKPAKIERIAVPRRTDWEIPTVELADKLNELIDAWNGGKA
jgi:hypothetical protein